MNEVLCTSCGNRNPVHTQFCNFCGTYLGWADDPATRPHPTVGTNLAAGRYPQPAPQPPPSPPPPGTPPPSPQWPRQTDTDLLVELDQQQPVVVTPGAPASPVMVHVTNTSTVVEAYRVIGANAPPWLVITPGQVRLLPGTDERVQVLLAIAPEVLVPVQRFRLFLRIQGESSQGLYRDVPVDAVVGEVIAPAQLRLEPSSVRLRDAATAQFRVLLDNRRSNVPMSFDLAGRDPEQQARFTFQPVRLDVPPGGTAAASLRVDAPLPPPGEQINRTLTVLAASGAQELTANAGLTQSTSAAVVDPPIGIRLDPSVVHAKRRTGATRVVLDNRRGTRPQGIHLEARDVENVVGFRIAPQDVQVAPGQSAMATITMQAPRPAAGETVTRSLIITAWDGHESIEGQGQLVQATPERRPFLRILLTLLGGLAMIVGSFLPWTVDPARAGVEWTYPRVSNFLLGLDTQAVDQVLEQLGVRGLISSLLTAGGFTVVLGVLAMLGLFGSGKLIRIAAVLGVLVLLLFFAAAIAALFVGSGFPGLAGGWLVVLAGCVVAFVGSYRPRA